MRPLSIGRGLDAPLDLGGDWLIHPRPVAWDSTEPPPDDAVGWRPVAVPGAWEAQGIPAAAEGPFWYKRGFEWGCTGGDGDVRGRGHGHGHGWGRDPDPDRDRDPDERLVLRFHGVSTVCRVYLNGHCLGEHEGIWDGFETDATSLAVPGRNSLALLIQKAGDGLPLRQAVAGFIPDVCVLFGGPWRTVEAARKRRIAIHTLHVVPRADERRLTVTVEGGIRGPEAPSQAAMAGPAGARAAPVAPPGAEAARDAHLLVQVIDPSGHEVVRRRLDLPGGEGPFRVCFDETFASVARWDLDTPNLYTLHVVAGDTRGPSDRATRRFGWRMVEAAGNRILLNGRPVFLRGLLHWGWYPETVAPVPGRDQIRAEILQSREAGFNLVKHCLYVPVEDYFDLADELGVLLWQELPLWLPEATRALKEKVRRQYPVIVERLHSHPSLILWSLGCELGAAADNEFLGGLYGQVKQAVGDALVRDNSGSGECYGGLLNEHADYYDYHFYTDPHFYGPLMDRFAADWREAKPWLFGEFCDQDVVRDARRLREASGGKDPWWLAPPEVADLKRDLLGYRAQIDRLAEEGLLGDYDRLLATSLAKEAEYRKTVVGTVRRYDRLAGYVLTSLRDTPISSSAFFDDFGSPKHPPEAWRRFNADTVLALAWDNRRDWVAGGDRARCWDHYNHLCGETVRAHVVVSHFGREPLRCDGVEWRLSAPDGGGAEGGGAGVEAMGAEPAGADGRPVLTRDLPPGTIAEVAVVEFAAPAVDRITRCELAVELYGSLGGRPVSLADAWPLWLYPKGELELPGGVAWFDPYGLLPGRPAGTAAPEVPRIPQAAGGTVLVTTAWDSRVESWVAEGGRALYVQPGEGPLPSEAGPFWREALQVFADPRLFEGFAGSGYCGLQWYSLATDRFWSLSGLAGSLPPGTTLRPLLRRLDVRRYVVHDYVVEAAVGRGRALLATLRLAGGLGDQASDLSQTVAGRALLARFTRALADGSASRAPAGSEER